MSENTFYVLHCVPCSSLLRTPLPKNKNRPDARNKSLHLSDGAKLLQNKDLKC